MAVRIQIVVIIDLLFVAKIQPIRWIFVLSSSWLSPINSHDT